MTDPTETVPSFRTALDQLLPNLVDEIKAGWLPMLLAGLLYMAMTVVMVFVILVVPYVFAAPGFGVMAVAYADQPEPPLWVLVITIVPAMLAMVGAMFGVMCVGEPGMRGAVLRALDADDAQPLSWSAPLQSFRVHLRQQSAVALVMGLVSVLLLPLLVFPSILFGFAAILALPGAALDGLGWREALGRSLSNAREYPGFHGGIVLVVFIVSMVGGAIPLVGQSFATIVILAWLRIAYRHRFPKT